jgi:hypothetical protein
MPLLNNRLELAENIKVSKSLSNLGATWGVRCTAASLPEHVGSGIVVNEGFETRATLRSELDGPGGSGDFNYRRLCLTFPAQENQFIPSQ